MAPKGGRASLHPLIFLLVPVVSAFPWWPCSGLTLSPPFSIKAKSLMLKCLQKGHRIPMMVMDNPSNDSGMPVEQRMGGISPPHTFFSLISSLPPPDTDTAPRFHFQPNKTMDFPDPDPEWNVTEWMRTCSSLMDLVKFMRNSSEGHQCYLRAFAAPLSWVALMRGGDNLDPEDYGRLVWAAKPFLQNMPPHELGLPSSIQGPHLTEMMKMMREVFGSLSEDQKDQIREWVKERFTQNHYKCSLAAWRGRPRLRHRPRRPPGDKPRPPPGDKPRPPPGDKPRPPPGDKPRPGSGKPPGNLLHSGETPQPAVMPPRCPSKLMWLRTEVMKMMGPFLTRLPVDDMRSISKDQLCPLVPTPEFSSSFRGVGVVTPWLGRRILRMIKECSNDSNDLQEFPKNLNRLGSLACFYDDIPPQNSSLSRQLLSQLENCSNSGVTTLKKRLVETVMSSSEDTASPELLRGLGVGVTELSPSHLSRFSPSVLQDTLATLGPKLKWRLSQAKSLVKALLRGKKEAAYIQVLKSLGSAVRGVASKVLRRVKPEGLLGSDGLQSVSQKMSKLQKTALLEGLRGGVNASELVNKVPASLLSRLSLSTLDQANLTSLHQLEGKSWTLAQSAFLVRKILGTAISPADMRQLGSAIKGVACEMIDRVSESDVMDMAQSLTETPRWLTKTQVCCAARKLFASLETKRTGYFNNVTEEELDQIPTPLLLHLSPRKIEGLPESVCPVLLEKMATANLSSLSLRSRSRPALTDRTLRCLLNGTNMSDLSSEEVLMLGSLLCDLPPTQLYLLNPEALNSTLQALATCSQIPPHHRGAIVQLLKQTYGDPSDWSEDTMESLGPLLLLDDSTVRALRYRSWLKAMLSDMMDSMPRPPSPPPPRDFSSGLDLSTLRWKIFSLSTSNSTTTSNSTVVPARRKREVTTQGEPVPLVSQIEDLGDANIYWSPAQLSMMPNDTFIVTVETLGAIPDYSPDQLSVLRLKTIEVFGPVSSLNEDQVLQVRCISRGFNLTELSSLPISSLDTLETLATCSWSQSQRETLWEAFAERTGMKVGELGAVEMVGLDQFICGLSPNASAHLDTEAFREAVGSVGQVQCPQVVTERLKDCAVTVFGQPFNWTQAQVNTLGNIMAGLSSPELRSLSLSVFPFLSQTSIPLIPADRLAALSVSQLVALGPDNSAMVTDAQRQRLSEEQIVALDNTLGLPTPRAKQPTQKPPSNMPQQSGASTLGTVGIGVLIQPFLILLLVLFL